MTTVHGPFFFLGTWADVFFKVFLTFRFNIRLASQIDPIGSQARGISLEKKLITWDTVNLRLESNSLILG